MARNIKNAEVERPAAETAELARESKTEGSAEALTGRVLRLGMDCGGRDREQRIDAALARFRAEFPRGDFGRTMTKSEEEEMLGFGQDGV